MAADDRVVVIDTGRATTKLGFAGEDDPKTIATVVGRFVKNMQHVVAAPGTDPSVCFVGEHLKHKNRYFRATTRELRPIDKHGRVSSFDDAEVLWSHTLRNELRVEAASATVLLTESPLNDVLRRTKTAEVFFEALGCSRLSLAPDAVVALLAASGRSDGCVLSCGAGHARAAGVVGLAIVGKVATGGVGGDALTQDLRRRLGLDSLAHAEHVKHGACFVAQDAASAEPQAAGTQGAAAATTFKLPDGHTVTIGAPHHLCECPEACFRSAREEHCGAARALQIPATAAPSSHQALIAAAAGSCHVQDQRRIGGVVVLSGGTTGLAGYDERLRRELTARRRRVKNGVLSMLRIAAPFTGAGDAAVRRRVCSFLAPDAAVVASVHAPLEPRVMRGSAKAERANAAWIGASMLGSLSSFDGYVNKAAWAEEGARALRRICPLGRLRFPGVGAS